MVTMVTKDVNINHPFILVYRMHVIATQNKCMFPTVIEYETNQTNIDVNQMGRFITMFQEYITTETVTKNTIIEIVTSQRNGMSMVDQMFDLITLYQLSFFRHVNHRKNNTLTNVPISEAEHEVVVKDRVMKYNEFRHYRTVLDSVI